MSKQLLCELCTDWFLKQARSEHVNLGAAVCSHLQMKVRMVMIICSEVTCLAKPALIAETSFQVVLKLLTHIHLLLTNTATSSCGPFPFAFGSGQSAVARPPSITSYVQSSEWCKEQAN